MGKPGPTVTKLSVPLKVKLVPTTEPGILQRASEEDVAEHIKGYAHPEASKAIQTFTESRSISCANYCCQEFSTMFPFAFTVFLPGDEQTVQQFVASRHKLTVCDLRCRLRMGLNTFDSGCMYGPERVLRIESRTEEDLIRAIDKLNEVFPTWKVWRRGKVDAQLL
ncbi:unnamed protein product [Schistocephalus solidus]|uniref:THUMP domain-containing protein n=1 Tax=Schistocephalus solidus TaxID=70667 RepID=A0A183S728_SCHSO|nr:unnamed protein product [Schistocephalus solidus]